MEIANGSPASALESMGGKPFFHSHVLNIAPIGKQQAGKGFVGFLYFLLRCTDATGGPKTLYLPQEPMSFLYYYVHSVTLTPQEIKDLHTLYSSHIITNVQLRCLYE